MKLRDRSNFKFPASLEVRDNDFLDGEAIFSVSAVDRAAFAVRRFCEIQKIIAR
jgi:hypothetical protein